jgi:hypothetical protein
MYPQPHFQFSHPPPFPPPFIDPAVAGKREALRWAKEFEQRHLHEVEETKKLVPSLVKHNLNKANILLTEIEKGEGDSLDEKKKEVEELLKPFKNDAVRDLIKIKIARQQRKMKWKKKKRKEAQEYNKQHRALGPILEKIIDEWQQSEFAKEEETRKRVQEEKEAAVRKQKQAKENKQKRELAALICRLEQLRRLRYKKKLAEGRPALDIDRFDSFLMPGNEVESNDSKDKEISPESNTNATNTTNNNTSDNINNEEDNDKEKEQNSEKPAAETNAELIYGRFKEDPEQFYYQAYASIDNLIAVRKEWDRYLVAIPGTGSRIPSYFIPPPPTPNPTWARFIVNNANNNM